MVPVSTHILGFFFSCNHVGRFRFTKKSIHSKSTPFALANCHQHLQVNEGVEDDFVKLAIHEVNIEFTHVLHDVLNALVIKHHLLLGVLPVDSYSRFRASMIISLVILGAIVFVSNLCVEV